MRRSGLWFGVRSGDRDVTDKILKSLENDKRTINGASG